MPKDYREGKGQTCQQCGRSIYLNRDFLYECKNHTPPLKYELDYTTGKLKEVK